MNAALSKSLSDQLYHCQYQNTNNLLNYNNYVVYVENPETCLT